MPPASASRIVLAGGTGFLGRALAARLARDGHEVVVLSRRDRPSSGGVRHVQWSPDGTAGAWAGHLDGAAAVVNLAGESIAAGRWTPARKAHLRDSRRHATSSLVQAIAACARPPAVFVSSSAIGYYGLCGDEMLTEDAPPGQDFLAQLCVEWEATARQVRPPTRVVLVRTGVVLDPGEGALPALLRPFRLFVGGPVGSGRQYLSWIHRDDWVSLVAWAIATPAVAGPLNATAPAPVSNAYFAQVVGRVLRRPARVTAPALAVRAALGEMGEVLALGGQRVLPARALEQGFHFAHPELEVALRSLLSR